MSSRTTNWLRQFTIAIVDIAIAFSVGTLGVSAYTILSTRGSVHTIAQIEETGMKADAVLVLGASVFADGTPSDILADRLEVASDLYLSGAASSIIASGDNRESHYNETDAMRDYCVNLGVPKDAIHVDRAGYNTYDSVFRAHYVYGAESVIIVTQAYHLYRALMIAGILGMDATGVAADKGAYNNQAIYSMREVMARDKDLLQALLKLPPSNLTQPID